MLEDLKPPVHVPKCKVRTIYETLEADDIKRLQQFINDDVTWNAFALSRALATKAIDLDSKVITKHRRGECSCSRILK
jgi:hypothetical protein